MGHSSQAPNQGCRVNDTPLSNDDTRERTWESCYWAEYALGYLRSFDSMAGTLIWHIRLNLRPFHRRYYAFSTEVTGYVCAWSAKTETFRPRALFNLLVISFSSLLFSFTLLLFLPLFLSTSLYFSFSFPSMFLFPLIFTLHSISGRDLEFGIARYPGRIDHHVLACHPVFRVFG